MFVFCVEICFAHCRVSVLQLAIMGHTLAEQKAEQWEFSKEHQRPAERPSPFSVAGRAAEAPAHALGDGEGTVAMQIGFCRSTLQGPGRSHDRHRRAYAS